MSLDVFKQSSYRKRFTIKKNFCSVCLCHRSSHSFSTNYCCSSLTKHVKRQICDTCLHQHVLSKLYSCLTSSIICPERNCSVNLSHSAICDLLLKYESKDLLNDYLREQQWEGKNDEWIKRFAARCPGCNVPIEKNGGCDEMICSRCQTHFYWSKAKRYLQTKHNNNKQQQYRSFFLIHPLIDGILFVCFLLCLILAIVIYFKE